MIGGASALGIGVLMALPAAGALTRPQTSRVMASQAWEVGPGSNGTGQSLDACKRPEFWKLAKPGGINPTFGDSLSVKTVKPVAINVPLAQAATAPIGCG